MECLGHLFTQPTLGSLGVHTLSVATLVVVNDGEVVDVWVDLRFSYH